MVDDYIAAAACPDASSSYTYTNISTNPVYNSIPWQPGLLHSIPHLSVHRESECDFRGNARVGVYEGNLGYWSICWWKTIPV